MIYKLFFSYFRRFFEIKSDYLQKTLAKLRIFRDLITIKTKTGR